MQSVLDLRFRFYLVLCQLNRMAQLADHIDAHQIYGRIKY